MKENASIKIEINKDFIRKVRESILDANEGRLVDHRELKLKWELKRASQDK